MTAADAWEAGADELDPERRGDPLASALELAAAGLPVFRAQPRGKRPLLAGWQAEATTDEAELWRLWRATPDATPAVATGGVAMVLDLDLHHDGAGETLALCEHRGLPETWTAETQSGGRHYYYRPDPRVDAPAVGILPGLDVRDRGSLVVAPRAVGERGRYRWLAGGPGSGLQIAPQPDWLVAWRLGARTLGRNPERARRGRQYEARPDGTHAPFRARGWPKGQRNDGLFRDACAMVHRGLPPDEVERLILTSATLCEPPLPEREALAVVRSAEAHR